MDNLNLKRVPVAKTGMLIRRPVAEVFEAFIDPGVTTKFWFTKSSGRLEVGKQVKWEWEMESDATDVVQLLIDKLKRAWFHS
jgi:uncharacterized protein YndB with AHSA1/START domain